MRERVLVLLLLASTTNFLLGCGEDNSPSGPNPANTFPIASTPERFVALLDSAIATMDFGLYRSLLDSSFQFRQVGWSVAPGELASWGLADELEIVRRMFSGEPNSYGQVVESIEIGIGVDTVVTDTTMSDVRPPGEEWFLVKVGGWGEVVLKEGSPWGPSLSPTLCKGLLVLRPDPSRPGHLVAVRQTDLDWGDKSGDAAGTEYYLWGWVKAQFLYGAETPETFLARFARKYAQSGRHPGDGYADVLDPEYVFQSVAEDVERGCPGSLGSLAERTTADRLRSHWRNHKGWRAYDVTLELEPLSIVGTRGEPWGGEGDGWWDVRAAAVLHATLVAPDGSENAGWIESVQRFILRPSGWGSRFVAFRQYDGELVFSSFGCSWGYLKAMFYPEDPEETVARFAAAYRAEDGSAYESCLHDRFRFETAPNGLGPPGESWDRAAEIGIAERMFTGWTNAEGQSVRSISLSVERVVTQAIDGSFPDRQPGETWYEARGDVYLSVAIDEGDGLEPVRYETASEHEFLVCPDPNGPRRFVIYRHIDPEPVEAGPGWESPGRWADGYVELDADETPGDGPDHIQIAEGETLSVDCWMHGTPTIGAWWITVCQEHDALEFLGAEYHLPEGWEASAPTFGWSCPTLSARAAEESDTVTLPQRAATIRYKVVRGDTYDALTVDAVNSGWATIDFTAGGAFIDEGGASLRVGRPNEKPSSWGSTKALFR